MSEVRILQQLVSRSHLLPAEANVSLQVLGGGDYRGLHLADSGLERGEAGPQAL